MPTSDHVLEGLTRLCRELGWLAAAWHVLTGAFLAALAMGWRPPRNFVAAAFSAPLLSVSLAAFRYGNPFNGTLFLFTALVALALARRLRSEDVAVSKSGRVWPGVLMISFGGVYPHFLEEGATLRYLWAAPLGLLPCPTLSLLVGMALLMENATSRASGLLLGGVGAFYGVLGVLWLGVTIDLVLLIGSGVLLAAALRGSGFSAAHPGFCP